jgi:hypothetical protein
MGDLESLTQLPAGEAEAGEGDWDEEGELLAAVALRARQRACGAQQAAPEPAQAPPQDHRPPHHHQQQNQQAAAPGVHPLLRQREDPTRQPPMAAGPPGTPSSAGHPLLSGRGGGSAGGGGGAAAGGGSQLPVGGGGKRRNSMGAGGGAGGLLFATPGSQARGSKAARGSTAKKPKFVIRDDTPPPAGLPWQSPVPGASAARPPLHPPFAAPHAGAAAQGPGQHRPQPPPPPQTQQQPPPQHPTADGEAANQTPCRPTDGAQPAPEAGMQVDAPDCVTPAGPSALARLLGGTGSTSGGAADAYMRPPGSRASSGGKTALRPWQPQHGEPPPGLVTPPPPGLAAAERTPQAPGTRGDGGDAGTTPPQNAAQLLSAQRAQQQQFLAALPEPSMPSPGSLLMQQRQGKGGRGGAGSGAPPGSLSWRLQQILQLQKLQLERLSAPNAGALASPGEYPGSRARRASWRRGCGDP